MFWADTGSKGLVVMAQSSWFQACWESVNWSAAGGKSGHQMLTSCFGKQLQLWEAEKEKGPNYKEEQLKWENIDNDITDSLTYLQRKKINESVKCVHVQVCIHIHVRVSKNTNL